jgi:hypothetical protein
MQLACLTSEIFLQYMMQQGMLEQTFVHSIGLPRIGSFFL